MSEFEDKKAMFALLSTQSILLNELYAGLFATNPTAREQVPPAVVRNAMFGQYADKRVMDEETAVDIHAQVVLNLTVFFEQVEARLRKDG